MGQPTPGYTEPEQGGRRGLWAALAAGAVLVGVAALFPTIETPPQAATPFTFASLSRAPTLGEMVPGWTDRLILAVGGAGSDTTVIATWRASDAVAKSGATIAAVDVAVDVSGEWVAALTDEAAGFVLRAGPVGGSLSDVADDVTGFAWHQTDAARLAWSTADGRTTTFDLQSGDRDAAETGSGRLQHWGGGGITLALPFGSSRVIADSGTSRLVDGSYVGYVPGGYAFRRDGAEPATSVLFLLTPDATATARIDLIGNDLRTLRLLANPTQPGVIAAAVETTDAAGGTSTDVRIVDRDGEDLAALGPVASTAMTWTSDGRWLVIVGRAESGPTLRFHDLVAGTTVTVSLGSAALGLDPAGEPVEIVAIGVTAAD